MAQGPPSSNLLPGGRGGGVYLQECSHYHHHRAIPIAHWNIMTQDGAAPAVGADLHPLLIWTEGEVRERSERSEAPQPPPEAGRGSRRIIGRQAGRQAGLL